MASSFRWLQFAKCLDQHAHGRKAGSKYTLVATDETRALGEKMKSAETSSDGVAFMYTLDVRQTPNLKQRCLCVDEEEQGITFSFS